MKLVNPTDEQLNAAFAEKVAGFHSIRHGYGYPNKDATGVVNIIRFTSSADAVLPWLEKHQHVPISYLSGRKKEKDQWEVRIYDAPHEGGYSGRAEFLPRAAVIALLRANGVEVEFTP